MAEPLIERVEQALEHRRTAMAETSKEREKEEKEDKAKQAKDEIEQSPADTFMDWLDTASERAKEQGSSVEAIITAVGQQLLGVDLNKPTKAEAQQMISPVAGAAVANPNPARST